VLAVSLGRATSTRPFHAEAQADTSDLVNAPALADALSPESWTGSLSTDAERRYATAGNWTMLSNLVGNGVKHLAISLSVPFNTSDYGSEIEIRIGASVMILGNGAVLDASGKGSFFYVRNNAVLALNSLTLQNGTVIPNDSSPNGGAVKNEGTLTLNHMQMFV
jgi:hypothetical protein